MMSKDVCLSVCLSLCLSVCLVVCYTPLLCQTAKRVVQFFPRGRSVILVCSELVKYENDIH